MTASIHLRVSVGEKKGTREAERYKERGRQKERC